MNSNHLKTSDRILLQQIGTYIEHHLAKDLSIATLARSHALNKHKLKAGFKLMFNRTIHRFIMEKRMERAKEFLCQTEKPMKEIASLVGYSQRNFFTAFKAYYFQTPDEVRKSMRNENRPSPF